MNYNPHSVKYNQLNQAIKVLQQRIDSINAELQWYQQFNIVAVQTDYANFNSLWLQQNQQLQLLQQASSEKEQLLQQVRVSQRTLWNPLNWFAAAERAKRKQGKLFTEQIEELRKNISTQSTISSNTAKKTQELLRQLEKYQAVKPEHLKTEVNNYSAEHAQRVNELNRVKTLKEAADTMLAQPLANLKKSQAELQKQTHIRQLATTLEEQLNKAANSYERKLIHEKSESQLGISRPASAKQKAERQITSLNHEIAKIEKRLRGIQQDFSRDIRTLVIDGNNMCYQHSQFIGVRAVKAFIEAIVAEYQIKVIFDASIRRHLNADDDAIKAMVDPHGKCNFVYVVATKQTADETILRLASEDEYSYVISNDRFKDYAELACVQQNRLIRHEILDNRLFVHSLGIDLHFNKVLAA